jgi:hypothetical protein
VSSLYGVHINVIVFIVVKFQVLCDKLLLKNTFTSHGPRTEKKAGNVHVIK